MKSSQKRSVAIMTARPVKLFIVFASILFNQDVASQNWNFDFGNNGNTTLALENRNTRGHRLTTLDDGSLLVGVNSDYSQFGALFDRNVYVYKLTADGEIDLNFGTNGYFFIPSGGFEAMSWLTSIVYSPYDDFIYGLATVQGSKKLFRLDVDGNLDTSFGNNGWKDEASDYSILLIQDDGKLILIGSQVSTNQVDHSLKRYNADGLPDNSFGIGGSIINNTTTFQREFIYAAKLQGNKILVVGDSYNSSPSQSNATIARYNYNGSLDTTFGLNGFNIANFGNQSFGAFRDIDVNSDNEIIVAGYNIYSGGTGGGNGNKAVLVKYDQNGGLLNSFNGNGIKIFNSINNGNDNFTSVGFLTDGSIVAGGSSGAPFPVMQSYYYMTKVNPYGNIVSTFFNTGYLVTDFSEGATNYVYDLEITDSDEIFSCGITRDVNDTHFIAVACKMDNSSLTVNEISLEPSSIVYPVPATEFVNISSSEEIISAKVYSTEGRILIDNHIDNLDNFSLNVEILPTGNYIISLLGISGNTYTKKFIKQ